LRLVRLFDPCRHFLGETGGGALSAKGWKILILVVTTPIALVALYLWLAMTWTYSEGERAGIFQKFSRKGWICKTWEGELAIYIVPGVAPTIWYFTVRDESIVPALNAELGKRVVMHYKEHRGVPRCFGDTGNFVSGVRAQE
jgi:hypothetical protein